MCMKLFTFSISVGFPTSKTMEFRKSVSHLHLYFDLNLFWQQNQEGVLWYCWSLSLDMILNQFYRPSTHEICFCKIHLNVIFPYHFQCSKWSLSKRFLPTRILCAFLDTSAHATYSAINLFHYTVQIVLV